MLSCASLHLSWNERWNIRGRTWHLLELITWSVYILLDDVFYRYCLKLPFSETSINGFKSGCQFDIIYSLTVLVWFFFFFSPLDCIGCIPLYKSLKNDVSWVRIERNDVILVGDRTFLLVSNIRAISAFDVTEIKRFCLCCPIVEIPFMDLSHPGDTQAIPEDTRTDYYGVESNWHVLANLMPETAVEDYCKYFFLGLLPRAATRRIKTWRVEFSTFCVPPFVTKPTIKTNARFR